MKYVGVRNWPEKAAALRRPPSATLSVEPRDLAFDCNRHLDLLAGGRAHVPESLYVRQLRSTGRSAEAATARAQAFLDLFERIRLEGMDYAHGRVAVTSEGIRLNGSHRAAVAVALGLSEIEVDVHEWAGPFGARRAAHVVLEAAVKRKAQLEYVDRRVRAVAGEGPVGAVVGVDVRVTKASWWRPGATPSAELILLVDDGESVHWIAAGETAWA